MAGPYAGVRVCDLSHVGDGSPALADELTAVGKFQKHVLRERFA